MSDPVDERRRDGGFSPIGRPTMLIDIAGRRIVIKPVVEPPRANHHLMRTAGPALAPAVLGPTDVALTSGDERALSLDIEGHRAGAGSIATTPIRSDPREGECADLVRATLRRDFR
jgi:hypothetical protein